MFHCMTLSVAPGSGESPDEDGSDDGGGDVDDEVAGEAVSGAGGAGTGAGGAGTGAGVVTTGRGLPVGVAVAVAVTGSGGGDDTVARVRRTPVNETVAR